MLRTGPRVLRVTGPIRGGVLGVGTVGIWIGLLAAMAGPARAFTISLSDADFGITPEFSSVTRFSITIDVDAPLAPGPYVDPSIHQVDYEIGGPLAPGTPSGFPAFALVRSIVGDELYTQGSSLRFEISGMADLSDGLQVSELVGVDPVLVFDAREVGTGRYHPLLLELNADGTGGVRNSNNMGGVNPATGEVVDVDFGQEYISNLSFDASSLTLAVPEPSAGLLLALGLVGLASYNGGANRRRWSRILSLSRPTSRPFHRRRGSAPSLPSSWSA